MLEFVCSNWGVCLTSARSLMHHSNTFPLLTTCHDQGTGSAVSYTIRTTNRRVDNRNEKQDANTVAWVAYKEKNILQCSKWRFIWCIGVACWICWYLYQNGFIIMQKIDLVWCSNSCIFLTSARSIMHQFNIFHLITSNRSQETVTAVSYNYI